MKDKEQARQKEIDEEGATLPLEDLDLRIVSDDVAYEKVDNSNKEQIFVYAKETDRTRFVMHVVGRMSDKNADDYITRGILIFEQGFTMEFATEIGIEIGEFILSVGNNPGAKLHLKRYIGATPEILEKFKDCIIL